MNRRIGFAITALSLFAPLTHAAQFSADKPTTNRLAALHSGESMTIAGFPVGPTRSDTIRFERVDVYSPDAHLYLIDGGGEQKEIPRSNLIFFRGYSDDGSSRIAMSLNSDSSFAGGGGSGPEGGFVLETDPIDPSNLFRAKSLEDAIPANVQLDFQCGSQRENLKASVVPNLASQLVAATKQTPAALTETNTHALRFAVVAVDTDHQFMSSLFSNNTTNATNWIAKMFNTMNMMYEKDLRVRLNIGTTILRTNTDPYGAASDIPADGTDLTVFGTYWQNNEGPVSRTFATLLSGRGPCTTNGNSISCNASGIAQIDAYCDKNVGGSYSVVQVFSSLTVDPNATIAGRLTGHELGHNFGASHTHCTNITTGASNVATNTIDVCYNGEANKGCYAGTTSCPASTAPGGTNGTIMSYCNTMSCGAGGQNALVFHPTQINQVLQPAINASPTGCLNGTDGIFFDDFEKPGG